MSSGTGALAAPPVALEEAIAGNRGPETGRPGSGSAGGFDGGAGALAEVRDDGGDSAPDGDTVGAEMFVVGDGRASAAGPTAGSPAPVRP
jgi:hypothetical protein